MKFNQLFKIERWKLLAAKLILLLLVTKSTNAYSQNIVSVKYSGTDCSNTFITKANLLKQICDSLILELVLPSKQSGAEAKHIAEKILCIPNKKYKIVSNDSIYKAIGSDIVSEVILRNKQNIYFRSSLSTLTQEDVDYINGFASAKSISKIEFSANNGEAFFDYETTFAFGKTKAIIFDLMYGQLWFYTLKTQSLSEPINLSEVLLPKIYERTGLSIKDKSEKYTCSFDSYSVKSDSVFQAVVAYQQPIYKGEKIEVVNAHALIEFDARMNLLAFSKVESLQNEDVHSFQFLNNQMAFALVEKKKSDGLTLVLYDISKGKFEKPKTLAFPFPYEYQESGLRDQLLGIKAINSKLFFSFSGYCFSIDQKEFKPLPFVNNNIDVRFDEGICKTDLSIANGFTHNNAAYIWASINGRFHLSKFSLQFDKLLYSREISVDIPSKTLYHFHEGTFYYIDEENNLRSFTVKNL